MEFIINYIDHKYVLIAGTKLELFETQGNDIFNFRCPFCQDSKKNKLKKRGYFYPKNNSISYKCHNCGITHSLASFLKAFDFNLFNEYKLDKFGNNKPKPVSTVSDKMILLKQREFDPLVDCIKLSDTEKSNAVKIYAISRGIPEYFFDYLYAAESLNLISNRIEKYQDRIYPNFPVLVIPFFRSDGSYNYIQCRTITNSAQKFTTFQLDENVPKLWGEFRLDWNNIIYILEGPIDAMFINNGVALAGASVNSTLSYIKSNQKLQLGEIDLKKLCIVFDNDYRYNEQILQLLLKRIDDGFSVLLYDKRFKWKDINEAYSMGHWSIETINSYVVNRTFQGLKAKLEITSLTRVRG